MHHVKAPARWVGHWLWHPVIRVLTGVIFSLVVGYLLANDVPWNALVNQFRNFPLHYALISLLFFALATALRAYRWQVLFLGEKVPLHRLVLVQNAGIGLNSISPIRVVSEVIQYGLLSLHYRVKGAAVVATLGIQRLQDFLVSTMLLVVGVLILPRLQGLAPYVAVAAALAILGVLAVPGFIWLSRRPGLTRIPQLSSIAGIVIDLSHSRTRLIYSSLITMVYWLFLGMSAWVLAYGMGLDISILVATLVVIITLNFAILLPSLPGAIGTFEFAVYYFLKSFDVSQAEALSFALVIHAVLFVPPILISLMMLPSYAIQRKASIAIFSKAPPRTA